MTGEEIDELKEVILVLSGMLNHEDEQWRHSSRIRAAARLARYAANLIEESEDHERANTRL